MTALGPYKDTQVVDFTELEERKLFVISGATGAGKTTIFDAITFALYGTASGSDRENITMLRSHFASDDVHTAVELTFRIHARTYRVFRQMGHVKKGNKTKTGDRYEFFEVTEAGEIPAVDRQMVTEVNEKIESLIGLTVEQFKQIVMLPQGEFRELLTSDTENKEEILRRIFQTERYQVMNDLLHQKQTELQQKFASKSEQLNRYVDSIHSSLAKREESELFVLLEQEYFQIDHVLEYLQTEINFYIELIKKDELLYKESIEAYEKQQERIANAQFINEQFNQLDQKTAQLEQLREQAEEMKQKGQALKAAERASQIEAYETQLEERQKEVHTAQNLVKENEQKLQQAKQAAQQAKESYEREEKRTAEREELTEQLLIYEKYVPVVQTIETERAHIVQLKKDLKVMDNHLISVSKQIKETDQNITEKQEKERELAQLLKGYADETIKYNDLRTSYKWWESLVKELIRCDQLQQSFTKKKQVYEQAAEQLSFVEKQWIEQQATVLAQSLVDGEACPVCGSNHHPNKQHTHVEFISDEQLEREKATVQGLQNEYHESHTKLTSAHDSVKQIKNHLDIDSISIEQALQGRDAIITEGKQVKANIETFKKQEEELTKLRSDLEKLQPSYEKLVKQKEKLELEVSAKQIEEATKIATFKESIREIPEQYQQLARLEKNIAKTKQLKEQLEKAWKQANEQLKQAETKLTKCQVQLENSTNQLNIAQTNVEQAVELFKSHLEKAQFPSIEAYGQAKLSEVEREQLKTEIEKYNQTIVTLENQLTDLKETLKHKARTNIEEMQEMLQQLKERYERAFEQMNRSKQYKDKAIELKENISMSKIEVDKLEQSVINVKDVYDVLRGQNNRKISFERYLQIDYLDQIIFAANSRFKTLTDGQYHLVRSERQESHGRQSGLTIDVYDGYTGQMRDVKTLSGGEKFIASLCLALGMSDVIQSFQGSIRIDTMFIDEGFGSLDEESLHKSIDALIQLQKTGRVIGVISHVQEIKQMFPARLEVTKTKEGHSSASFVLR